MWIYKYVSDTTLITKIWSSVIKNKKPLKFEEYNKNIIKRFFWQIIKGFSIT